MAVAAIMHRTRERRCLRPALRREAATRPNVRAAAAFERHRVEVGLGLLHMGLACGTFGIVCGHERPH